MEVLAKLSSMREEIVPAAGLIAAIRETFDNELADSFFVSVMCKRLAAMRPDLTFSPFTLIWCALNSDRVGVAVSWAYTMVDYQRRYGHPLTLHAWRRHFKYGTPTSEEQRRIWYAQKKQKDGKEYNAVDAMEAWENIVSDA
jgi:hypothetical protein